MLGNLDIERDFPVRTYNEMLGTTLHELAHILERPSLFQPRPYHHQEASRYTSQVEEHERILADLKAKFEPAENTVNN